MYLRHGHVHVFWNALITLAEQTKVNGTVDPLSEEPRPCRADFSMGH